MKECAWAGRPYIPPREPARGKGPYICRMAPGEGSLTFEWLDNDFSGEHTVYWKKRGADAWESRAITGPVMTLTDLAPYTDYELFVARGDGSARSSARLFYTCGAEGIVVNYNHPDDDFYGYSGRYLSSPSIVRLPSGRLLIGHDVFGDGPQQGLTILYTSADEGETWSFLNELYPLFWAKFFVHQGKLFVIGLLRLYGDLVVSCSEDEGATWREPTILMHGDNGYQAGMHQNVTPVLRYGGRIYTGIECGSWGQRNSRAFGHMLLSAPAECDLMAKENWEFTPMAFFDPAKAELPTAEYVTAMEGNAVAGPDGEIYCLLRMDPVNCERKAPINKAIMTKLIDFEHPLEFVDVIHPRVGIRHKFFIQQDAKTGLYFMLHNEEMEKNIGRRCIISLSVSENLKDWRKLRTLLDCTRLPRNGVSYPAFIIDGEDILYVSRSAFGNLRSEHDNNYITFHRLKNFRALL